MWKEVERWCEVWKVDAIDLLIHNAGTGYWGRTEVETNEDIRRVVAVNLGAPVSLTHTLFGRLKKVEGHVVFIGSVVSALACPEYAVYGATKAAVDGLVRSLAYELEPRVTVQVIHPGATRTGLHEKMGLTSDRVDWRRFPSAASIAKKVDGAIGRRQRAVLGFGNRVAWAVGRRCPRLADAALRSPGSAEADCATRRAKIEHAVVTGAADGIGKALAWRLAQDGTHITGVDVDAARSRTAEEELAAIGSCARYVVGDLGDNDANDRTIDCCEVTRSICSSTTQGSTRSGGCPRSNSTR